MMKKLLVGMCLGVLGFCSLGTIGAYTIDTSFPYEKPNKTGEQAVDIGQVIKDDAIDPTDSASEKIQQAYKIDLNDDQRATAYLKEVVNWTLAVIGLVALTTVIYGFYRIVLSSDNEEGLKNAKKIIFIALVALVIIGTAWIIVSQFFDIFFQVKKDIDV